MIQFFFPLGKALINPEMIPGGAGQSKDAKDLQGQAVGLGPRPPEVGSLESLQMSLTMAPQME